MHKNLTAIMERDLRVKLRDRILSIITENTLKISVFDRRRNIVSRSDYAKKLGQQITPGGELEMRFLEISLRRFTDLAEGSGKCPVTQLPYNLHVFIEFVDERANGSNADFEMWSFIFALRDEFLRNNLITGITDAVKVEIEPMELPDELNFGNDTLTDGLGYFTDLKLLINFYS